MREQDKCRNDSASERNDRFSYDSGNESHALSSDVRMMKILTASNEQLQLLDQILDGRKRQFLEPSPTASGPILLGMGAAAKTLGVSRATLWRMIQVGRLQKVELLPGSFRVRRADLEAIAAGKGE